jgi:signal transduction histidine kinase
MKKSFENFLRLRYAPPFLIGAALVLAVVGELAYQRTVSTLRYGIALTEARIGSARILQRLTDAETGQRGYLLTSSPSYLEPMRQAEQELRSNKKVFDFIAGIGPTGPRDAKQINDLAMQRFGELGRAIILADIGDKAGALAFINSGEGKQHMDQLRAHFDTKFAEAARLQEGARSVIYDALLFSRTAVLLLSLLMALGLYWYWHKLQQLDQERHSRQQSLQAEVASKTAELRTLAGYLQTVREDEKSYLARELHDELGGLLTAAKLTLARMRAKLALDAEMLERIEQVTLYLNGGIALKRKIVEDLRPSTLTALGLNVALATMCTDSSQHLGIAIQTSITTVQLPPETELGIYRIVQEAFTNIGKYAEATQVSVELQQTETEILLDIKDNGHGFDMSSLKPGQHGLGGMRFRVESLSGKMTLHSAPGHGVHIAVRLPRQPAAA